MTPNEIKEIIEKTIGKKIRHYWMYLVLSSFIGIASAFSVEYFKTKAQNIATKQDIKEITQKVEEVKAEIQSHQEVEKLKRELKYNAILNSLSIIDAFMSEHYSIKNGTPFDKQSSSTEEVRSVHNNLILTCRDTQLVNLFVKILLPNKYSTKEDPLMLLNQYRNLARKELDFGTNLTLDTNNVWFSKTVFTK